MSAQPIGALGRYELFETIGEGGFSRVHRVRRDGRDYAAKILSVDVARPDDAALARFEREVEALGRIEHPNLIELVDHGVDETHGAYFITPLIVGLTLRDLAAERPLPPESALLLLEPVFDAVGALHAAGLVHRDLKPDNVMVTPSGDVILIDLGLALTDTQSRLTRTGTVTGSVPYMSPEQISAEPLGPPSDVWSLGVTFYELVAGRRPFWRDRPSEELASILAGMHERLSSVDRRVGQTLDDLVERLLEPVPSERFADARGAHAALVACIDWCAPMHRRMERAAVVTDPVAYAERIAVSRVDALRDEARTLIAGGESFRAMKLLDRALAYRPTDEAVLELVVAASEHAPPPVVTETRSEAPANLSASFESFVSWIEQRVVDGVKSVHAAPARKPGEGGGIAIWAVLLGIFGLAFMAAIIAAAILGAVL